MTFEVINVKKSCSCKFLQKKFVLVIKKMSHAFSCIIFTMQSKQWKMEWFTKPTENNF